MALVKQIADKHIDQTFDKDDPMVCPDLPRDIIFSIIRDAEISYGGSWHQLHKKKFQGVMNHFNKPVFDGMGNPVGHGVWMASGHWGSHPEEAGDFDDEMNSWVFNLVEKGYEFHEPCVNKLFGYGYPRQQHESSLLMPLMGFVFRDDEWEPPDEHLSHEWGYRNDREILLPGIGTGAYCVSDRFFSVASIYTS